MKSEFAGSHRAAAPIAEGACRMTGWEGEMIPRGH